jgi:hypothetical protein
MRMFNSGMLLGAIFALSGITAHAENLVGGTTTVAFDPGFVNELTSAEITPTAIAPSPSLGVFPITANTATTISHSGGVLFSGTDSGSPASLAISNFVINLSADSVTGDAIADGKDLGVVPLFSLVPPTGNATAGLDLSSTAIGAINTVFGTDLPTGATIFVGEATVKGPNSVPEPSTLGLALLSAAGLMIAFARRRSRAALLPAGYVPCLRTARTA